MLSGLGFVAQSMDEGILRIQRLFQGLDLMLQIADVVSPLAVELCASIPSRQNTNRPGIGFSSSEFIERMNRSTHKLACSVGRVFSSRLHPGQN